MDWQGVLQFSLLKLRAITDIVGELLQLCYPQNRPDVMYRKPVCDTTTALLTLPDARFSIHPPSPPTFCFRPNVQDLSPTRPEPPEPSAASVIASAGNPLDDSEPMRDDLMDILRAANKAALEEQQADLHRQREEESSPAGAAPRGDAGALGGWMGGWMGGWVPYHACATVHDACD